LFGAGWLHAMARALGPWHPDGARETIDDRLVRRWATGERPIPRWVFHALAEIVDKRITTTEIQARALSAFRIRLGNEANPGGVADSQQAREEAPVTPREFLEKVVRPNMGC
jgi:hypothetical protein